MVVNFRVCEISRGTRKLIQTLILKIIKKKSTLVEFLNPFIVIQQNDF